MPVRPICNETLLPAVFFERYDIIREWKRRTEPDRPGVPAQAPSAVSPMHSISDIVELLYIDQSTDTLNGQIMTMRHFLSVTSRESLHRIKWSVESVRRSLLDEMMSVLHRQSRLVQLDLGAIRQEHSPELALDASESQLRGYVMLASAKLPLISNVWPRRWSRPGWSGCCTNSSSPGPSRKPWLK